MLAGTLARSHKSASARPAATWWQAVLTVTLALLLVFMLADPAMAAKKKKKHVSAYKAPNQAEFVVDANSGQILHSLNPDVQCYPASLTKVMTLYMLFAQLDAGKLHMDDRLRVSAYATRQAPSKLGFSPGDTITVRDAILGIVTKSANDVAVTVAENIGGSEAAFASRMTSTARRLGMMNTSFVNASGLPNPRQLTTARDMAILAIRIRRDFPQYYAYFSTTEFAWRGQIIPSHNHLLGRYAGTNGLKTGYTAASGFNLTTAVDRNGRRVVGVVLGGSSVRARDLRMMAMLDAALPDAISRPSLQIASLKTPPLSGGVSPTLVASNENTPAVAASSKPANTIETAKTAAKMDAILDNSDDDQAVETPPAKAAATRKPARIAVAAARPVKQAPSASVTRVAYSLPAARPAKTGKTDSGSKSLASNVADMLITPAEASTGGSDGNRTREGEPVAWKLGDPLFPRGTWVIQIGAYSDPDLAVSRIKEAMKIAPTQLKKVVPSTVAVKTDSGKTLYRSRFGGFKTEAAARAACGHLGRKSFSCIAIPPV
ncbi:MAG: SPOR domain-containing protein [Parvibaculaceae bacterium]|nr:SPOR domain-containing protein [Parvibaculaceae bacterium]